MSGLGLQLFYENSAGDIGVKDGRLITGNSLNTIVLTSLFSNRRAEDDDPISEQDKQNIENGYWAEALMSHGNKHFGSKYWQYLRSTIVLAVNGLQQSAIEATKWLKDTGIVETIVVETNRKGIDRIEQIITYTEPTGETTQIIFKNLWDEIRGL